MVVLFCFIMKVLAVGILKAEGACIRNPTICQSLTKKKKNNQGQILTLCHNDRRIEELLWQ